MLYSGKGYFEHFRRCHAAEDEGVVGVGTKDDRDSDNEVSSDGDNSPSSSQESGKLQMGHQIVNSQPYKVKSLLTEKVGELVAALHNGLACRALRRSLRLQPMA